MVGKDYMRVRLNTKVLPAIAGFAERICRLWNIASANRALEQAARYRAEGNDAGVRRVEMRARWYLGEEA